MRMIRANRFARIARATKLLRFSLLFCAFLLSFPRISKILQRGRSLFFSGDPRFFAKKARIGRSRRLNAILYLLHPLDRFRTPSAIGSAIGRPLSRPISHPNTGGSPLNRRGPPSTYFFWSTKLKTKTTRKMKKGRVR